MHCYNLMIDVTVMVTFVNVKSLEILLLFIAVQYGNNLASLFIKRSNNETQESMKDTHD